MTIVAISFLKVLLLILDFYRWSLIVYAVMSWLVLFNIVNYHNQLVVMVNNFLRGLLEPILRPLRRLLPPMGGLDLSFLALYMLVFLMQELATRTIYALIIRGGGL